MISINYDDFSKIKNVHPLVISSHEFAWKLKEINDVLQWLRENNQIVLGGDIIDVHKNYTYDNWFYNYNSLVSHSENVNISIDTALNYTEKYLKKNGDNYYVVLVLK